jgi:hypothetical protein
MPDIIDTYYVNCPNCGQPMQVAEVVNGAGQHFEAEVCSGEFCDHELVLELDTAPPEELKGGCYA